MILGNLMYKIVNLEIGCPSSTPKACKRKLGERLKKYEYDDSFIDNLNDDMVIGYYVAKEIVKDIASDYIDAAFASLKKNEDDRAKEIGVVRDVMCEMIALKTSSFFSLEKTQKQLKEILEKHECDDSFIDGVNCDITAGYNLGIDVLMEMTGNYLHVLEENRKKV